MFQSEDAKLEFANAGGVDLVMNSLLKSGAGVGHYQNGTVVLQNYSFGSDDRAGHLVDKDAHILLANLLKQNHASGHEAIMTSGCWALCNLVSRGSTASKVAVAESIVAAELIPVVVSGLEQYPDVKQLQMAACRVLKELSKASQVARDAIIQAKGPVAISFAICHHHGKDSDVVTGACAALRHVVPN
jgi:hypothetical protein